MLVENYQDVNSDFREKLEEDAEFEVIGDISKLQEDAEKATTEEHAKEAAAGSTNGADKQGTYTNWCWRTDLFQRNASCAIQSNVFHCTSLVLVIMLSVRVVCDVKLSRVDAVSTFFCLV